MQKNISLKDVVRTLPELRTNVEIAEISKVSYSQIIQWTRVKKDEEYYHLFILEYYRRVNEEEEQKCIEKYRLKQDVTVEFIGSKIIPYRILNKFMDSSLAWKKDFANRLMSSNTSLLSAQVEFIGSVIDVRHNRRTPLTKAKTHISRSTGTKKQFDHL